VHMSIFCIILSKEINIYKISRSILNREEETLSYSERKMIKEVFAQAARKDTIAMLGDHTNLMTELLGDITEPIARPPVRQLWITPREALEALGEDVKRFSNPDGD